jgi:hypothetical protein
MELFFLDLKLIAASALGMGVQLLVKNKSFSATAAKANVQHSLKSFLMRDFGSIAWTFMGISAIFLITSGMISNIIKHTPDDPQPYLWNFIFMSLQDIAIVFITILFLTIGYMGQDFLLRFLSKTSDRLRAEIDRKTNIADEAEGHLNRPTKV